MKLAVGQKRDRREGKTRRKVLRGLMEYKKNFDIAQELGVSVRTVAYHVSHLLTEYRCLNRVALADEALRRRGKIRYGGRIVRLTPAIQKLFDQQAAEGLRF